MIPEELGIRPVWAQINLDNLAHNIGQVKKLINPHTKIMACVKAEAYGHGAEECSKAFLEAGAEQLAVATPGEGFRLRKAGIQAPILCLGYTPPHLYPQAVKHRVAVAIYSRAAGRALAEEARKQGSEALFHAKIETGMNRLGFPPTLETVETIKELANTQGLKMAGVFTHFADSESKDKTYTHQQFQKYMYVVDKLEEKGVDIPLRHVSNSAAVIDLPQYNLDMVRPGIMLYGYFPSPEVDHSKADLRKAMTLHAQVSHVKTIPQGSKVGYGLTYTAKRETRLATIPLGYGDGYPRALSNKGQIEVRGKRAPIAGRVCMDQLMVDVTDIPGVEVGDHVVLMGDGEGTAPTGDEIAAQVGTIPHELIATITQRVPRVYIKNNKPIKAVRL